MIDASNDLYIRLVLLLSLAGVVATPWLVVRGVVLLLRTGNRRTTHTVVKGAVALTWACAIGMYTWGVLHLVLLDESNQARACEEALGPERAELVEGYEYQFMPLRFKCRVTGGQTFQAVVPGYVNPATGIFGVSAAALMLANTARSERKP
ncbi:hypothetical protein ACFT9I_20090 [Streptomyces sp. NPDC057137]|uniref:hypothetical protein n=1 Tax=Streptomyces sp. NPDC057137 TaxID=3346030 RepID=UPI003641ABF6